MCLMLAITLRRLSLVSERCDTAEARRIYQLPADICNARNIALYLLRAGHTEQQNRPSAAASHCRIN